MLDPEIIALNKTVLDFINICGQNLYSIEQYSCRDIPEKRSNQLKDLINSNKQTEDDIIECYAEKETLDCNTDIAIILMIFNDNVVSYLSYNIFQNEDVTEEYKKVAYLTYMCTNKPQRRKNISILLLCIAFIQFLSVNCTSIVTNASPALLEGLKTKFNFTSFPLSDSTFLDEYRSISYLIFKEFNCIYRFDNISDKTKFIQNIKKSINNCKLQEIPELYDPRSPRGRVIMQRSAILDPRSPRSRSANGGKRYRKTLKKSKKIKKIKRKMRKTK